MHPVNSRSHYHIFFPTKDNLQDLVQADENGVSLIDASLLWKMISAFRRMIFSGKSGPAGLADLVSGLTFEF